jgi:hypothetical protein
MNRYLTFLVKKKKKKKTFKKTTTKKENFKNGENEIVARPTLEIPKNGNNQYRLPDATRSLSRLFPFSLSLYRSLKNCGGDLVIP